MTRRAARVLVVAVLVLLLGSALVFLLVHKAESVRKKPREAREPGAIDVLLVVVDTQRADALTPYGSPIDTTPFLAELAERGVVFENAFSPAPWTVPAMYSMMTSLHPREHGINTGANLGSRVVGQPSLPPVARTLAEEMSEGGYETFGVCTNFHLGAKFGFDQGFDVFVGDDFSFLPFPNRAVHSISEQVRSSRKHFTWVHYFDPHYPYRTNAPWFSQWNRSPFGSYNQLSHAEVARVYREVNHIPPGDPLPRERLRRLHKIGVLGSMRPFLFFSYMKNQVSSPDDPRARFLQAAYLSELRRVDAAMELALAELGVDDRTLVIVTSDHGEEFYDHGDLGHRNSNSLYQELIRVPLIVVLPDRRAAGEVIEEPVGTLDLMPTILELAGLPVPEDLSGRSLVPLIEGDEQGRRDFHSEVMTFAPPNRRPGDKDQIRALVRFPWKYIHDYRKNSGELYDLSADPRERNDLADEHPHRAAEMRREIERWKESTVPRWKTTIRRPLDREAAERLKKMGYIQ